MSKLDQMAAQIAKDAAAQAPVAKVTASKAKWGSVVPALLGAVTAGPFANAVLPDHILAEMDFWKYLVWTVVQAALFGGLTFLNIWAAPPNEIKKSDA